MHCYNSYFDCSNSINLYLQQGSPMIAKQEDRPLSQPSLQTACKLNQTPINFRALFVSHSHDLDQLVELIREQVYMDYKDYQAVRAYFQSHKQQFDQIAQLRVQSNTEIALNTSNNKSIGDEASNISYQQILDFILIASKAYLMKHQYSACIKILLDNLAVDSQSLVVPFKILYERQILLIKAHYLNRHENKSPKAAEECLRNIFAAGKLYQENKILCRDWSQIKSNVKIYDKSITQLYQTIKKSLKVEISQAGQMVAIITEFIQSLKNKTAIFSGLPIFLISTKWLANAKAFLQNSSQVPSPGPPLNLDLLNSVFEFEPHPQSSKFYMDTLMFPVTEQVDYQILTPHQWRPLFNKLGGIQIKRFSIQDKSITNNLSTDTLIKMVLECDGHIFVLQWQAQSLWEQSVLPYIRQNMLGLGQMKEQCEKVNNQNQIYYEDQPVKGVMRQTKNRYKYCAIPQQMQKIFSVRFLERLLSTYDMQSYSISGNMQSFGIMGLHVNLSKELLARSKKQQINYLLYIISCLHSLGSLNEFIGLCSTTESFMAASQGQPESEVEYLAAFWDFMKRMWFSHQNQKVLDCTSFCSLLISRLQGIDKEKEQLPYVLNYGNRLLHVMQRILLPIFTMCPSFSLQQKPAKFYSSLEHMRTLGLDNLRKSYSQQSFSVFAQYHYLQFNCPNCCEEIGYELVPKLTMAVDIPQSGQCLKFYLVIPNLIGRTKLSASNNSKLDEKQSVRQFLQTQPTVGASSDNFRGKSVQQVTIKLKNNSKISEAMAILSEKLEINGAFSLLSSENVPTQKKFHIIMVLIDEETNSFSEIYNTNKKTNLPDMQVNEVNSKINQIDKRKSKLYVFVVAIQDEDKQLAIISFKDPITNQCKAFAQLIELKQTPSTSNIVFAAERSKKMIQESLANPAIQITKIEVIQNDSSKDQKSRITCFINLFTDTKIANQRTTQKFHILDKHIQNQSAKNANQNKITYLEQCIQAMYGQQIKSSGGSKKNTHKEKLQCHKCKRTVNPTFQQRLLEFSKVVIIGLNRRSESIGMRIDTNIKVPNSLNMKNFMMVDQSSRRKNYALRSVIVRTNNQKESNIASRERYSAVVKSVKNGKWYHEQADQLHEIDFDSLDGSSIELLIYERDQQPRSEIGLHVA